MTVRPIDDSQIRASLLGLLAGKFSSDPNTRVFSEFGLRHGLVRADIAVVNGHIHGYELKSDLDTLKRLPTQADIYSSVFDHMTLVIAERHLNKVLEMVPEWWGIEVVHRDSNERLKFSVVRPSLDNPSVDVLSVAKLLWREEALELLESVAAADGIRSKRRMILYEKLAEVLDQKTLCKEVRKCLLTRTNWRSDELQKPSDD